MAENAYQWPIERNTSKKQLGVHKLVVLTTLSSQVASLSKQVSLLTAQANIIKTPTKTCDLFRGPHTSMQCEERNPFMPISTKTSKLCGEPKPPK